MAEIAGPTTDEERPSFDSVLRECQQEYVESLREPGRVTNLFRDHYDADVSALPRSPSASHKRRLMAEVLAAAGRLAASRSVRLLLLAIPAVSDVSDGHPRRVDPARFPEYRPSGLTDGIEEIARTARLPVVNFFGPFREKSGAALFYPIDGHWNVAAQALAARLVAERITSDGLLP
jgi:hypothetical protein